MSVTALPAQTGSGELRNLLDQAERLAGAAGRADLVERLGRARTRLTSRPIRIAVNAGPGAESLIRMLRAIGTDWLPGASFADVPGYPGSGQLPAAGDSDVLLYLTAAAHEYGRGELEAVTWLRGHRVPILAVLTDYETVPDLPAVQRSNREQLQSAGLDSPSIPQLPVSAGLCETGLRCGEQATVVASGLPQLLECLRDRIDTRVDVSLHQAVLNEVRHVADQLLPGMDEELRRLRADGAGSPALRRRGAMAELERRQRFSTAWQLALSDGATEMNSAVDFDLRERLRGVLTTADEQITEGGPLADWDAFDATLREKIDKEARTNYQDLRRRATCLSRTVAVELVGMRAGATGKVARPDLVVEDPDEGLAKITPTEAPQGGSGLVSRIVNGVRSSYGGILMVGVLTSLAGEKLISVYSVGAGLLLGIYSFLEERRTIHERRRAEARVSVSKLMDAANFRVGDHQRAQLRTVHRTLRDHFTAINDERLKEASDAVRAAGEARADDEQQERRAMELETHIAELTELREQVRGHGPAASTRQDGRRRDGTTASTV